MGILNRLQKRLEKLGAGTSVSKPTDPERLAFSAEIPAAGGAPLWRMDVQIVSEPQGDGEKLRLRAHFQTNFASALRPALAAARDKAAQPVVGTALTLAERTGALAQRAFASPLVSRLAEPLLRHDFNTWIDLQASTASLADGAGALLPQSDKLAALGIAPSRRKDGPLAESWAGESPNGYAQVSIVQFDKKHLPPRLATLLSGRPFQMAAAVVNTVEEK